MTFVGIENRTSTIINLIFNVILLIAGLFAVFYDNFEKDGFSSECGSTLLSMVIGITLLMTVYSFSNIWMLIKHKFHPQTRRRLKSFLLGIRVLSLISNIVIFSLIIYFVYVEFSEKLCFQTVPVSYVYLYIIMLFTGLETFFIAIYLIALSCFCCCIGCIWMLGVDMVELEKHKDDSGLPYLNRTRVDTFRDLLGLGGEPDLSCVICAVEYCDEAILRKLPCDHYFHQGCIDTWLEKHDTCPICRHKIQEIIKEKSIEENPIEEKPIEEKPIEEKPIEEKPNSNLENV